MTYTLTKTATRALVALTLLLCCQLASAKKVIIGKNCYELNKTTMTASLTFFDKKSAIPSESYLRKVVIPETVEHNGKSYTVTEIGANCFWKNLDDRYNHLYPPKLAITIPKTVKHIDEEAFRLRDFSVFNVDPESPFFTVKDNILYDKSFTKAICAIDDSVTDTLALPSTLKQIYPGAFSGQLHSRVANLILPKGLEKIGFDAFSYCHIDNVVIPGSVKSIGIRAFYRSGIKNITFEEGIESIDARFAFDGQFKSIKFPKSLKSIGDYTFEDFSSDVSILPIYIPENVEYIGQSAFTSFSARYIVSPANQYYSSDEHALYNKDKSELLHVSKTAGKTYRIPVSVNSIGGRNVFSDVDTLIIDHPLKSYITKNTQKSSQYAGENKKARRSSEEKKFNNFQWVKIIYAIPSEITKLRQYNKNVHDISELEQ